MMEDMPHRVYDEWLLYLRADPFTEERQDWRIAMLAAVVTNMWRDPKRSSRAKIEDFMPKFEPKKPLTADGMLDKMKQLTVALGGTIIDNRKGKDGSNNPGSKAISTASN